eukprot:2583055-Rhodomonas_salina.1
MGPVLVVVIQGMVPPGTDYQVHTTEPPSRSTGRARPPIVLRARYAMSGTEPPRRSCVFWDERV